MQASFWFIDLFKFRSSNPAFAAIERARRLVVVFTFLQLIILALALAIVIHTLADLYSAVDLPDVVRHLVATVFALIALAVSIWMAWLGLRCLRIYRQPEYI